MNSITPLLVALLAAGILNFVRDGVKWYRDRRRANQPQQVEAARVHEGVRQADESVIVIARARDQLAADNAALRAEREETAKRHAAERAEWQAERTELRDEIDELEAKLRAALGEVQALKIKHGMH